MTYTVVHDMHFVGPDGRGTEVLRAGEKVESVADYQMADLPLADREAWAGPDTSRRIPAAPGEAADAHPRWKGARDRCPDAVPFIWNGRLRWADRGSDLTRIGDAPRKRQLIVGG